MSDRYTDLLSAYLDEELSASEHAEVERHLEECAECAATLADLTSIVARASTLGDAEGADARVAAQLWPGIEARIHRPRATLVEGGAPDRRRSFSMPQLAAACLATAIITGAAVWFSQKGTPSEPGELIPGSAVSRMTAETASTHPNANATAVEELRTALANSRDDLDPATVRTLEESLMVIEVAIREAQRALDADPHNPYVRAHLDETMRRKVELLHRATMLASASR